MTRLLVGYKASDLTPELLVGDVLCHTLDIYHAHAIEKVWHAKTICSAHLPEGSWDEIFFRTGPKLSSAELSLDLLQEIARLVRGPLRPPRFHLDFVGRERDRNDLLAKVRDDPTRVRDFSARWFASVPGGPRLEFVSYPGCFCHRRHDEGGLALAEVAAREVEGWGSGRVEKLKSGKVEKWKSGKVEEWKSGGGRLKILDMGCGCGLVGLLIATRINPSACALTLVDSHTRAVEAARANAASFGLEAEILLSDAGTPAETDGTFDVFVGNPPYYSDYRIADVFLETAARALKKGGMCLSVCKNAAGLEPVQRRYFPNVEVIPRRGYAVLKSIA